MTHTDFILFYLSRKVKKGEAGRGKNSWRDIRVIPAIQPSLKLLMTGHIRAYTVYVQRTVYIYTHMHS